MTFVESILDVARERPIDEATIVIRDLILKWASNEQLSAHVASR